MTTEVQPNTIADAIRKAVDLQPGEQLYTVIDACQAYELVQLAKNEYGQPTRMLFKGAAAAAPEVESVAPYFILIDLETDFLEQWTTYWGKNAGILFVSAATPKEIFRHLRNIFVVQDETEQEYFFRFYDPRVLRVYLPTCTSEETIEFFGPLNRIILEVVNRRALETHSQTSGQLKSSTHSFES